jgi:predicted nucleic acid-binding protein
VKTSIYIETSVVSYLTARPAKDLVMAGHQLATADFWERISDFDVFISELVLQEAGKGDPSAAAKRLQALTGFEELEINAYCNELAKVLIKTGAIPEKFPEDALHIATATIHAIDLIVTWNFKHINNPVMRAEIRQAIQSQGLICPELCSPDELLGEGNA